MATSRTVSRPGSAKRSIVRLVVINWMIGAALGVLCAGLLLWLDIAGLRTLMFRDAATMAAGLALLLGGFAVTFGSVVAGSAIMALAAREERNDRGRPALAEPALAAIPARRRDA